MNEEEKKHYIDFCRINYIYIDVINDDPDDPYHIYNPKNEKFYENEYKLILEGIYISGKENNLAKNYFTEDYYIYPNHTFEHYFNHLVEKIIVKCDNNKLPNNMIQSQVGTFYPIKGTYTFERNENIVRKYYHGRILDFTNSDDISLFNKCLYSELNLMIEKEFSHQFSYINENTINFSRISHAKLVFDHKIDIDKLDIFIETTHYNIIYYDPQFEEERFVFCE